METREIKFRGQCAISKEMVFGDLIHGVSHKAGNLYILPNQHNLAYVKHCDPLDGVRVIPETVGQFTGLTDKNGKEIYDGDILDFDEKEWGGKFTPEVVEMKNIIGAWDMAGSLSDLKEWRQVIGNIHEHPNLLTPNNQ